MSVSKGSFPDVGREETLVADPALTHGCSQDGLFEDFHFGVGVVREVEGRRLNDGGFFRGSEFVFAVVRDDAVAHLRREDRGKSGISLIFSLIISHPMTMWPMS